MLFLQVGKQKGFSSAAAPCSCGVGAPLLSPPYMRGRARVRTLFLVSPALRTRGAYPRVGMFFFHPGDLLCYAASPVCAQRLTLEVRIPQGTKGFKCRFDLPCYPQAKFDQLL